jgi:phage terminase large subunit
MNLKAYTDPDVTLIVNQGGSSSSKTWSILQLLYEIAKNRKSRNGKIETVITIVRESGRVIKDSVLKDFLDIVGDEINNSSIITEYNKTDKTFIVRSQKDRTHNTRIIFWGIDDEQKSRGARRDILYVNEANEISRDVFEQLYMRTREKTFIDFNPSVEFWAHKKFKKETIASLTGENKYAKEYSETDKTWMVFVKSNYKDNHMLSENVINKIESFQYTDPTYWRVYGLGELGISDRLVYPLWHICDQMPEICDRQGYGLDFGYTNDPTSLVHVMIVGQNLFIDEIIYETDCRIEKLSTLMEMFGLERRVDDIVGDTSGGTLEELKQMGWLITPAFKPAGSILRGIEKIKSFKVHITRRSKNLQSELRLYEWKKGLDGKPDNSINPKGGNDHALDATRYIVDKLTLSGKKIRPFLTW